jgi:hypothetical protein
VKALNAVVRRLERAFLGGLMVVAARLVERRLPKRRARRGR